MRASVSQSVRGTYQLQMDLLLTRLLQKNDNSYN